MLHNELLKIHMHFSVIIHAKIAAAVLSYFYPTSWL